MSVCFEIIVRQTTQVKDMCEIVRHTPIAVAFHDHNDFQAEVDASIVCILFNLKRMEVPRDDHI